MPESLQRMSALAALCRRGSYGASATHAGVVLSELCDLTLLDLRGNPQHREFLAAAAAALGLGLPLLPNTSATSERGTILWLGPDQWLLVGERFRETAPIAGGFVTDVSHGRAAVRISGPGTRELLAQGCSIDLHPRALRPGQCAQTSMAHVNVLLRLLNAEGDFELYCARSYAGSLWHWLTEAAAGFGYQVA